MREIKFRGMDIKTKKWVYGSYVKCTNDGYPSAQIFHDGWDLTEYDSFKERTWWQVVPESVGEFTGLKEKNGKEIYDGDILSAPHEDLKPHKPVKFWDAGFRCGTRLVSYWAEEDIEVIGNIWDNPELLEEKNG